MSRRKIVSKQQISLELKLLAKNMKRVAEMIRPYSRKNADEMIGASEMALDWGLDILED